MSNVDATRKKMPFGEWRERFMREAREDTYALETLNRICPSQANRTVVLELLFHHVHGDYGIGAGPRDWKAFKSELNGLRQKALALASELERFKHLLIFSLPLIPETFLARIGGSSTWRKAIDSPNEVFLGSPVEELKRMENYINHVITEGDKIWNTRELGNLNLGLLSVYLKRVTGEWQDDAVATLLHLAYRASGKNWEAEESPAKAIGERRRRFGGPTDYQLDWIHLALHADTHAGRQRFDPVLNANAKVCLPYPRFSNVIVLGSRWKTNFIKQT